MATLGTSGRRRRMGEAVTGLAATSFRDAVIEGLQLLNRSGSAARRLMLDVFENAQGTVQARVGGAREQAQETWDSLEALFQQRVQRAMHQLGVPTAEEIRLLARRVEELNQSVQRLEARGSRASRVRTKVSGGARRRAKSQATRGKSAKRRVATPRRRRAST